MWSPGIHKYTMGYRLLAASLLPAMHSSWQIISRSKRDANGEENGGPILHPIAPHTMHGIQFAAPATTGDERVDYIKREGVRFAD